MARSSLFPPSVQPGKPILGSCPDGWTTLTFGDVLRVVERPVALDDDAEYQLVTAKRSRGGVVARSRLKGRDILTKTQFMIERGDFLMSNRQIIHGGCGLVPPALHGAIVSNEYSVLRPTPRLHIEYLAYLTHSIYFQQTCFHASVGVDVEKMIFDCERWLSFKLHLPPLHEQRRIAEILSSVDEAIAATRAVIEQTRKVKQAVLERLLTKGIGHTRFKQTEIGEIPEGWRTGKVGDFFTLQRGFDITEKSASAGEYPVVSSSGISYYHSIAMTSGPAVITGRKGKLGQVHFIEGSCWPHDTTLWVKDFKGSDPKFIYWFLRSLNLEQFDATTAVPTLNRNVVHALKCNFPPKAEQLLIADHLDSLEETERSQTRSLAYYEHMKSALMSDLLTGRKRVSDPLTLAAE